MRFKGLDLNLLVAFDALLDERSVSRAAVRLRLSQPAMSAALTRLREFFGDAILSLDGKKMIPTPYALRLRPKVIELLANANGLISASSAFDPATSSRRFSLGISDYLSIVLLRPLLAHLEMVAPNLTFDLIPPSDQMLPALESGEIDLVVTPEEHISSDHPAQLLLEERHVVVGCKSNPMLDHAISTEDFCQAGHVVMEFGRTSRPKAFAEKHLGRSQITRRIEIMVSSFSLVPDLIVGTKRIAVMHERLARVFAERVPITIVELPFEFPLLREHIQLHRTRQDDDGLRWLIGELHRHVPHPIATTTTAS